MATMTAAADLEMYRPNIARALGQYADPTPTYRVRPGTSDWKAVREVWERNAYLRRGVAVQQGETWLDAGANMGAFADLAARAGAAKVIAYECESSNALLATINNAQHSGVRVERAALVADSLAGTITLHVNSGALALRRHSVVRARRASEPQQVPAHGISAVMDEHRFDGAKLNIEGAEIAILTTWTPPKHLRALTVEWSFDVDPLTATLGLALERLRSRYARVELSRKVDFSRADFPWFPPQCYIYASD